MKQNVIPSIGHDLARTYQDLLNTRELARTAVTDAKDARTRALEEVEAFDRSVAGVLPILDDAAIAKARAHEEALRAHVAGCDRAVADAEEWDRAAFRAIAEAFEAGAVALQPAALADRLEEQLELVVGHASALAAILAHVSETIAGHNAEVEATRSLAEALGRSYDAEPAAAHLPRAILASKLFLAQVPPHLASMLTVPPTAHALLALVAATIGKGHMLEGGQRSLLPDSDLDAVAVLLCGDADAYVRSSAKRRSEQNDLMQEEGFLANMATSLTSPHAARTRGEVRMRLRAFVDAPGTSETSRRKGRELIEKIDGLPPQTQLPGTGAFRRAPEEHALSEAADAEE